MSLIVKAPAKKEKQSPYAYAWVKDERKFASLVFDQNVMYIWEEKGVWLATAIIDSKVYRAERKTLEDAAKAADRLLYKTYPHVWTKTDPRVIIGPWKGDLKCQ